MSLATRLYNGEVSYDFVSRRRRWYSISAVVLVVAVAALVVRGLNLGIDFKGGSTYELPRNGHTTAEATQVLQREGVQDPVVQEIGQGRIRITTPVQTNDQVNGTVAALSQRFGVKADDVNPSTVGPTWGSTVTNKALTGLVIFLLAVVVFLAVRFEPKMAAAAMLALAHDIVITVGVYALVGFEVTPATVIAFLTILGFSLYDTVVVFDRVREMTAGLGSGSRRSYSQAANLALNQTLVRSINTSIIALVPVAALLFVGAGLLGAGTLKDLALAQFIGLIAGTYSSIFIATPFLAQLKEREPAMRALAARVGRAQAAGKGERPEGAAPATGPRRRPTTTTALPGDGGADEETGADGVPGSGGGADDDLVAVTAGAPAARRVAPTRPGQQQRRRGRPGRPHGKKRR